MSFTPSNCLTDYQNLLSLLPRFFCFLGIQRAEKMDFPGSLNSPSVFKPQMKFEFLYTESILQSFFNIYKVTHWDYKKKEMTDSLWLMKKRKIPPTFFFNQMLYLKTKGMGQDRYTQQLSIKSTKWAIYAMIHFHQNSRQFCWHSIHKQCHEFRYILKTCTWRAYYMFKKLKYFSGSLPCCQSYEKQILACRQVRRLNCLLPLPLRKCRSLPRIILPSHLYQVSEPI